MKQLASFLTLAVVTASAVLTPINADSAEAIATLRGKAIATEPATAPMPKVSNKDLRRMRNYPEQPPTIPHKIRGYQVDINANKCLTCHSRRATEESQAPMVSVTHFMDRDGQVRAQISPRRYFCNQCHVPQMEMKPLVDNDFRDVDEVIKGLNNKKGK